MSQRADPNQLRQEFKKHLTSSEIVDFGVDLPAGADHYRAFVGPPYNYDINGAMQFAMLLELGLREYSRVLEIGAGSLRLGRLLIPFLMPDRYFGLEPNVKILNVGIARNLGAEADHNPLIAAKRPRFAHNTDFDFSFVPEKPDFIMAQSIASHTGVNETIRLLTSISGALKDTGVAVVTYIRCENPDLSNKKDGWFYPECVTYTDNDFGALAKGVGLVAHRANWPILNKHPSGMITTQAPCVLTKKGWNPSPSQVAASLAGMPIRRIG